MLRMHALLSSVFGCDERLGGWRRGALGTKRRRRLHLEQLEERKLLSVSSPELLSVDVDPLPPSRVEPEFAETASVAPLDSPLLAEDGSSPVEQAVAQQDSVLQEVEVAHLGGAPEGPLGSYLVSAAGTGVEGRMSSWKVTDADATPALLNSSDTFRGSDIELTVLYPAENSELARRPFLLSRIGTDGNLWLESHHLTIPGNFVHDDTRGYGENAGVAVLEHAIAQRPAEANDQHALVVTPVIASSEDEGAHLRVITWQVDVDTEEIQGLADSGPMELTDPPAVDGELSIEHQTAGVFILSYTTADGRPATRFVGVTDDGQVIDSGGGAPGNDYQGGPLSMSADALAIAPLGPSSHVAMMQENGAVEMAVWERHLEGCFFFLCDHEPYLVGHSSDDGNPAAKGISLPDPPLAHAYEKSSTPNERFGTAIANGDFNGDGIADVAVGAPADVVDDQEDAGAVTVLYGSDIGLFRSEFNWTFHQDTTDKQGNPILGKANEGDRFGQALAAGDFNGDGHDDLAIGVPGESIEADGIDHAGVVQILYGGPDGLTAEGNQLFRQGQDGLSGDTDAEDWFGWTLAAANFDDPDTDQFDDLVVGIPFEDLNGQGITDAGAIHLIRGSETGLTATGDHTIHQNRTGTLDTAEVGDHFGSALAVGDFDDDGHPDLAVGVPGQSFFGWNDAGAVHLFRGSGSGITLYDQQLISQDGIRSSANQLIGDISDATEQGDRFGASLAVGDFNADQYDDLAIGAPREDLAGHDFVNHGRVHILSGSDALLTTSGEQVIDQTSPGISTNPQPGGRFGYSLAAGRVDQDPHTDLLVGVPHYDFVRDENGLTVTYVNSGMATLLWGDSVGISAANSQTFQQGEGGLASSAQAGENFGFAVALEDLDGDGFLDAVVGVPGHLNKFLGNEKPQSGSIHVIDGSAGGLSSVDRLWAQGTARHIRAKVAVASWEQVYGTGEGALYELMPMDEPEAVHAASVTKTMTLRMAVEALEAGAINLDDQVEIGAKAADTGGSKMDPNLELGDIVPLETLLYGMMASSGNRASVAIARHVAVNWLGAADDPVEAFDAFVDLMNQRAGDNDLAMYDTTFGHPAGGMTTTPQDLINLFRDSWRHPLFRQFASATFSHDGESVNGDPPKTWSLNRSTDYVGLDGWKGGNGRVGSVAGPSVPRCTQCWVGQATRADFSLIVGVQQSSRGSLNGKRLFDYGFQRLFTPDRRGSNDVSPGGPIIIDPSQAQMGDLTDFAIDHITDTWIVTSGVDAGGQMQIQTWNVAATPGTVESLGGQIQQHTALTSATSKLLVAGVDLISLPTTGKVVGDYVAGTIDDGDLRLDVWRLGAELVDPPASIAGRHVFYNDSAFDDSPLADPGDDMAVATDKSALQPGEVARFENYTNYTSGINGIMIDVHGLANPDSITAADFEFTTGNDDTPSDWLLANDPLSVTVRAGAGVDGSDRISIAWAANDLDGVDDPHEAVGGGWLGVRMLANENTGLAVDDWHAWGNAPGEVGNSSDNAVVNLLDALQTFNALEVGVGLENSFDHNRDGSVNVLDALRSFNQQTAGRFALQLLDVSQIDAAASPMAEANFKTAAQADLANRSTTDKSEVVSKGTSPRAPKALPLGNSSPEAQNNAFADEDEELLELLAHNLATHR